jgi:hypothetical protein
MMEAAGGLAHGDGDGERRGRAELGGISVHEMMKQRVAAGAQQILGTLWRVKPDVMWKLLMSQEVMQALKAENFKSGTHICQKSLHDTADSMSTTSVLDLWRVFVLFFFVVCLFVFFSSSFVAFHSTCNV